MPFKDREKRLQYWREYHQRNKDKRHKQNAEWRANHPDQVKANNKAWYDANKEYSSATSKAWRKAHPTCDHDKYLDLKHWRWEDVEGYDGWTTNVIVHHKREALGYTWYQLVEEGRYFHCRADELLCCTRQRHQEIHNEINKFLGRSKNKLTEEVNKCR